MEGEGLWTQVREARESAEQGHCELRTGWERSRVRLDKDHGMAWCPECFQTKADTSQPPTGEEEIPDFELSLWLWAMRVSSRGLGSEKFCSRRHIGGCCGLTCALPRLAPAPSPGHLSCRAQGSRAGKGGAGPGEVPGKAGLS